MNFLRGLSKVTAPSSICAQCARTLRSRRGITSTAFNYHKPSATSRSILVPISDGIPSFHRKVHKRSYTTPSSADSLIEEIQEQYATAKDEFEIAMEETEKKSVYAADDRGAANEELGKLKELYEEALKGENGEEVKRRVGNRIRELENAIKSMEELALED